MKHWRVAQLCLIPLPTQHPESKLRLIHHGYHDKLWRADFSPAEPCHEGLHEHTRTHAAKAATLEEVRNSITSGRTCGQGFSRAFQWSVPLLCGICASSIIFGTSSGFGQSDTNAYWTSKQLLRHCHWAILPQLSLSRFNVERDPI